jgi:hypothetical protein
MLQQDSLTLFHLNLLTVLSRQFLLLLVDNNKKSFCLSIKTDRVAGRNVMKHKKVYLLPLAAFFSPKISPRINIDLRSKCMQMCLCAFDMKYPLLLSNFEETAMYR